MTKNLTAAVFAVLLAQFDDGFSSPPPFGSAGESPYGVGEATLWDDGWYGEDDSWMSFGVEESQTDEDDGGN